MDARCPDWEVIGRFAEGQATPDELARVENHLGDCDSCCSLVAELASDENDDDTTEDAAAIGEGAVARNGYSAPTVTAPAHPLAIGTAVGATLPAGTLLGRYEVRRWLGRGGMGDVYEGFDRHLERRVALKVLRDGGGNREVARQRLGREAKSLARLSHPNVVAAHDVGLEGDRLFLVMELVEGPTLASWLKTAPRTWREILDVFLEAGEGLAAAHAVGVIHRDFKPQNVLIGADGKPRVSDFGLARSGSDDNDSDGPSGNSSGPSSDGTESLTATGDLIGTPRYMAPEQILGHPIDARADQFSFCVALYEALYSTHPFATADTRVPAGAPSSPTLLKGNGLDIPKSAILANRPAPPKRNERQVPRGVSTALERGLGAGPALRFESMRSLLDALQKPSGLGRRGRTLVAATIVAAVSIAGATGWTAHRKGSPIVLTLTGEPADWSAAPVFFRVADQIYCVDPLTERKVRVVWGHPRRVDDVDVVTGNRQPADLVPETYSHGCPQLSPDGQKLLYEGYDSKHRPHIFYATNPRGERAEPIVSCASPTHRSEPLWLSSNEFVFDSDLMHPAVHSLDGSRTWIIPDSGRPRHSTNGFFKTVSPRGDRIAVIQQPEVFSSMGIFVYRWPGLDLDYQINTETRGLLWRFGSSANRLFGWTSTSTDDWIISYDNERKTLSNFGRVTGRHASHLLEIRPRRSVLVTRRGTTHVRFLDADGSQQEVPTLGGTDLSASLTPSGDVIFSSEVGTTISAYVWHAGSKHLDRLTEGPKDFPVAALNNDTFIVSHADSRGHRGLYQCSFGARPGSGDCRVISTPFAGFQISISPDARWMAYVESTQSGAALRVLSLKTGETSELNSNVGICQPMWAGPRMLWASVRVGDSFYWTAYDAETKTMTGESAPAGGGCFSGELDRNPPVRPRAWVAEEVDYDLRLLDK